MMDSSHIPNIVNEHFASVGSKLASKIPSSKQHYLDFVNKNMLAMPSFFFQPLTYDCVKTEILSLPNNKSHGLYFSPTKLLKCSIDIIAPVLSEVINISISLERYPTKLKLSKIVPDFKSDDETDPNNIRPTILDKTVEKIVYLDSIFLNIVAVPVLPSPPSPESNVVVYSKESLIPGRLWEATLNWGKGFSFRKGVVLEIVLLRRKVDMMGKTFSSSFVLDCI